MEPHRRRVDLDAEEILALVGRLDDASGFDTPRERFRRFLTDRGSDPDLIRLLIETCQRVGDGHHRRALQDCVVTLGRSLGFETAFCRHPAAAGSAPHQGEWRARHRVRLVVDVRTDRVPRPHLDSLTQAMAGTALFSDNVDRDERLLGLCVLSADAPRQAEALATREKDDLRVASVRALLTLVDMIGTGDISHDEVVRLFLSAKGIDLVVDLMQRQRGQRGLTGEQRERMEPAPAGSGVPVEYWMASLARNGSASAEQLLQAVVARRHVLGIVEGRNQRPCKAGDWICFVVPGRGVVGQGRIGGGEAAGNGSAAVRSSDRFDRLLPFSEIQLYDSPVVPTRQIELRLAALATAASAGAVLEPISRQEFLELTAAAAGRPEPDDTAA